MNALKTFLGGIAGLLIFGVGSILLFQLSGIDPYADASSGTITFVIICGAVVAFIAGYFAKLIAPVGSLAANYAVFFITSIFGVFPDQVPRQPLHATRRDFLIRTIVARRWSFAPEIRR